MAACWRQIIQPGSYLFDQGWIKLLRFFFLVVVALLIDVVAFPRHGLGHGNGGFLGACVARDDRYQHDATQIVLRPRRGKRHSLITTSHAMPAALIAI